MNDQNTNNANNSINDSVNETTGKAQDACQKELDALKEKYIRVAADFENFKRRSDKEKAQWISAGQMPILLDLLEIVDNFERALQQQMTQQASSPDNSWRTGFEMIYKSLQKMLTKHNVTEITETKTFDPLLHEALMHVESPDHASGSIVAILEKGYRFKDTVLRPAKVSVAK